VVTGTAPPASGLYFGRIVHRRRRPVEHGFAYDVCGLLVDLDELPELDRRLRLFSWNRPNVFAFNHRDHGPRNGSSLKDWVARHLAAVGIDLDGGRVLVLCFPRLFGYVFNPLSVWFCYRPDGSLAALVLEVSNMAHESHSYLLSAGPSDNGRWLSARFAKVFHVSDFVSMDAEYCCRILAPGERVCMQIRELEHADETLVAVWRGRRVPLTDATLLYALARFPLMTFKVWTAIYWEGWRLVRKGVPRYPRSEALARELTYAGWARAEPRIPRAADPATP
jgi:uncharacterized protein